MHLIDPIQLFKSFDFSNITRAIFPFVPYFEEDHFWVAVGAGKGGLTVGCELEFVFGWAFELTISCVCPTKRALTIAEPPIPSVVKLGVAFCVAV